MTIEEIIAETLNPDELDGDASEPLEVFLDADGEFVVEGGATDGERLPENLPIVALLN